ncbi:hypothetical protein J3E73DRAFT_20732 [Bipolaris maydis]|nr:hypothetical protein J3E73DRAFT_20732 [Bipolaris maydis]
MQIKALFITLFSSLALANPLGASQKRACGPSTTYVIRPGDTFIFIANRFNTGVCEIAQASCISNINTIMAGQRIIVPINCNPTDDTSCVK